jgi:hypothetical protein
LAESISPRRNEQRISAIHSKAHQPINQSSAAVLTNLVAESPQPLHEGMRLGRVQAVELWPEVAAQGGEGLARLIELHGWP